MTEPLNIPMSFDMMKADSKQQAIAASNEFTSRMVTEKLMTTEMVTRVPTTDIGSITLGYVIEEMRALGNKLDAIYAYPVGSSPDGKVIVREVCMIWSRNSLLV